MLLTAGLIDQLQELSKAERADALLALLEFCQAFGKPHLHSGIGIRKLRQVDFECRAGLRLRLVVRDLRDALQAWFIGSHDDIKRLIRSGLIS